MMKIGLMSKCHTLQTWHLGNVIPAEARLDGVREPVGIVRLRGRGWGWDGCNFFANATKDE